MGTESSTTTTSRRVWRTSRASQCASPERNLQYIQHRELGWCLPLTFVVTRDEQPRALPAVVAGEVAKNASAPTHSLAAATAHTHNRLAFRPRIENISSLAALPLPASHAKSKGAPSFQAMGGETIPGPRNWTGNSLRRHGGEAYAIAGERHVESSLRVPVPPAVSH